MKRLKTSFILILAVMMLCCACMTAYAQAAVETGASPIAGSESQPEGPMPDPLADVQDLTPDMPEAPAAPETQQGAAAAEQQPESGSDLPYFVGAGIAVLLFIGVAVFCKYNGTNNL